MLSLFRHGAAQESPWAQCGPGFRLPPRPVFEPVQGQPGDLHVSADEANLVEGGISTLTGNVEVERDGAQIVADKLTYDEPERRLEVEGNVEMWDEGAYVSGERGQHEIDNDITTVENAAYMFLGSHSHGRAASAILTDDDVVRVRDADYTTCDPGSDTWRLQAERIKLDYGTDVGTARNVWLKVKGVPVFYTPFITFPLSDERKSGFLVPQLRVSSSTGVDLTVPYYFNLAPQYDATLAVRPMTQRGVQGQGEFRYLTHRGEGLLAGEYLPSDSDANRDRSAVRVEHTGEFASRWRADVDFNWVSDEDYFSDLGTNLAIASQSLLERRGDITYLGAGWRARARVQSFQNLDSSRPPERRPYARLPQLLVRSAERERNRRLNLTGFGETVNFHRRVGVNGQRLDLRPSLSYPLRSAAWHLIPRASARFTAYDLDGIAPGADENPSRTLPTLSLDGGLFFERDARLGGSRFLQTLEPRAFYLYTPFEDQTDLPVFDTGRFDFSFAQLFREDRFSGADRVGDANQLSLALTTRLLAQASGDELLRASIGQIRFLRDRTVSLPDEPPETQAGSALVGEVSAVLAGDWRATWGMQWDPSESVTDKHTVSLRYQPDERRVVNVAYRMVRQSFEQTDFSAAWPLGRDWRLVGRFNYALDDETILETFAGVEYESCCWAFRTVVRRYLSGPGGEQTNAFFVQLELKGLTGIGRSTVDFLERSIPGYENEF